MDVTAVMAAMVAPAADAMLRATVVATGVTAALGAGAMVVAVASVYSVVTAGVATVATPAMAATAVTATAVQDRLPLRPGPPSRLLRPHRNRKRHQPLSANWKTARRVVRT